MTPEREQLQDRLRTLLLDEQRPYRRVWEDQVVRESDEPVHYGAVARVLANHEGLGMRYRNYVEPVRQALKFGSPTRRILRLLIKAFKMREHEEELWSLYRAATKK